MIPQKISRRGFGRLGAGLAGGGLAAGALGACSKQASASGGGKPSGELSILVSSADASDAAFRQVNKKFADKYPDVKVKFSTVSNDNYPAALSSRLTANNVDIFVVQSMSVPPAYAKGSESDSVRLAKAGGIVDLSGQDFMKRYEPSVLQTLKLDGKDFVVPTGLSYTTGIYYNKKIFAQHKLTAPKTWNELVSVCQALRKAGVSPFGIGGKEGWPAGLLMLAAAEGIYPTADAKADLAKKLWTNAAKLTDPGPLKVLQKTETIYSFGQPEFAGTSYDDIPSGFARQKYAMIADGTWNQPVIDKAVNHAFDYGYIPTPMGDTAESNNHLTGKIELMLGVAAGSKNKTTALEWLRFFSQSDTYKGFLTGSGFSSAQPGIKQSKFLDSITPYTKKFLTPWSHFWFANNKAGQAAVYPFNYPALKPMGKATPQQAAAAAQKAWAGAR